MPAWEAAQYALGLVLPPLLVAHVVGTRIAGGASAPRIRIPRISSLSGCSCRRRRSPGVTLVLAWLHACIGRHYWLRFRPWYRRPPLAFRGGAAAADLALARFVAAGREVAPAAQHAGWTEAMLRAANAPDAAESARLRDIPAASSMLLSRARRVRGARRAAAPGAGGAP
jgi:adenylate cyclase